MKESKVKALQDLEKYDSDYFTHSEDGKRFSGQKIYGKKQWNKILIHFDPIKFCY